MIVCMPLPLFRDNILSNPIICSVTGWDEALSCFCPNLGDIVLVSALAFDASFYAFLVSDFVFPCLSVFPAALGFGLNMVLGGFLWLFYRSAVLLFNTL